MENIDYSTLENVEIIINLEGGLPGGKVLEPEEMVLMVLMRQQLEQHPHFIEQYAGAVLTRVESDRGVKDTQKGRMGLRYAVQGHVPSEWWGCYVTSSHEPHIDFDKGIVLVTRAVK